MQDQRDPTRLRGAKWAEEDFAESIKKQRERFGWSQAHLAMQLQLLGIQLDDSAITRIERGSRTIRLYEAVAIAAAFQLTVDEMLRPALSSDEQLEQARDHLERAHLRAAQAVSEHDAAKARLGTLLRLAAEAGQAS